MIKYLEGISEIIKGNLDRLPFNRFKNINYVI